MAASCPADQAEKTSEAVANQMLATIYGQCIGDALGLLTEFMQKKEAKIHYGKWTKNLTYGLKVPDFHRSRWKDGDWTDDSDQMYLILQSLLYNRGEVVQVDFAKRMKRWMCRGFPEHGDFGGMGLGQTTGAVLRDPRFTDTPEEVAKHCWELTKRYIAPNGGVMRCSILGLHDWKHMDKVVENARIICRTTHYDPRCQASVVAVTSCISLMLQRTAEKGHVGYSSKEVDQLIKQSYDIASSVLETEEEKKELWRFMSCTKLKDLKLCEPGKIGYTYKSMGSGFWVLKQKKFREALTELVMEGGDADSNACVGGSLLGCRLGLSAIPEQWMSELLHKDMLIDLHQRFVRLQSEMDKPAEERTANEDLSIESLNVVADRIQAAQRDAVEEASKKKTAEEALQKQEAAEAEDASKTEADAGTDEKTTEEDMDSEPTS